MTEAPQKFLDLVDGQLSSARHAALTWEGTFEEYLAIVEERPWVARNAWQRLLDMIESHGSVRADKNGIRRWRIFSDPFSGGDDAVYGLDSSLARLVQTIRAGARGLGPERRVVLLHGPVGSSKSTIARILKRGLEEYSRTDEGALYTFSWHVDGEVVPSPMNQDPLLLFPRESHAAVEERINKRLRREYRITIQGDLDPV